MIHDDDTPTTGSGLSDADIDALLDQVDTDYEALPLIERRRLRRSVQQAQWELAHPEGYRFMPHVDFTELLLPTPSWDIASITTTAQAIAAETIAEAKARADAIITAAESKAREVDQIALKTLNDAHRDADEIRARAAAELNDARCVAQQVRHEAAEVQETARQVLEQAEHAALLRTYTLADDDMVSLPHSAVYANTCGSGKSVFPSVPMWDRHAPVQVRHQTLAKALDQLGAASCVEKGSLREAAAEVARRVLALFPHENSRPNLVDDWTREVLAMTGLSLRHHGDTPEVRHWSLVLKCTAEMLSTPPNITHGDWEGWNLGEDLSRSATAGLLAPIFTVTDSRADRVADNLKARGLRYSIFGLGKRPEVLSLLRKSELPAGSEAESVVSVVSGLTVEDLERL